MIDVRARYQRLKALAENSAATENERAYARVLMARLSEKYGVQISDWITQRFEPRSPADQQLLLHLVAHYHCQLRQDPPHFYVSGAPADVTELLTDYGTYSKKLEELVSLTTIAAIKGWGVYAEGSPSDVQAKTEKPTFPVEVAQDLSRMFHGALAVALKTRRPNYRLKQLPAPKRPGLDWFTRILLGPAGPAGP